MKRSIELELCDHGFHTRTAVVTAALDKLTGIKKEKGTFEA